MAARLLDVIDPIHRGPRCMFRLPQPHNYGSRSFSPGKYVPGGERDGRTLIIPYPPTTVTVPAAKGLATFLGDKRGQAPFVQSTLRAAPRQTEPVPFARKTCRTRRKNAGLGLDENWYPSARGSMSTGTWPPPKRCSPNWGKPCAKATWPAGSVAPCATAVLHAWHDMGRYRPRKSGTAGPITEVLPIVDFSSPLPSGDGQGVRVKRSHASTRKPFSRHSPHPNPLPEGEGTDLQDSSYNSARVESIRRVAVLQKRSSIWPRLSRSRSAARRIARSCS